LSLYVIDFIVNAIQADIHIVTLALGVPVLVNDIVNVPFQIGLAALQLSESVFIPGYLCLNFSAINLLPDLRLNILRKFGVLNQQLCVLYHLGFYPFTFDAVLSTLTTFRFEVVSALIVKMLPNGSVRLLPVSYTHLTLPTIYSV